MKESQVRCWKIRGCNSENEWEEHFISYPEENLGYDLITCLNCGQIYSASVSKQVYTGPKIKEVVINLNCIKCGKSLKNNIANYPETFVSKHLSVGHINRSVNIPDDDLSEVIRFPEIYS